jgi:hypothetical protein
MSFSEVVYHVSILAQSRTDAEHRGIGNKILSVEELERTVEKILKNLHNPKEIWQSQSYENKVMLQKMYFNENIEYSKNELFGTPEKCYILRFFEQIGSKNTQNFSDVDSRRFELLTSSVQVRRSTN